MSDVVEVEHRARLNFYGLSNASGLDTGSERGLVCAFEQLRNKFAIRDGWSVFIARGGIRVPERAVVLNTIVPREVVQVKLEPCRQTCSLKVSTKQEAGDSKEVGKGGRESVHGS